MDIREKLGFDKIIEELEKYLTDIGRTKIPEIKFSTDYSWIAKQLSAVSDFIDILHNHNFPLDYYYDLRPSLRKIEVAGVYMSEVELLRLWQSLETLKAIRQFFLRREWQDKFGALREIASGIKYFPFVIERIRSVINRNGEILDSASRELQSIRKALQQKQAEVGRIVNQVFKQAQKQGIVEQDAAVVVRGGKFLIPVVAAKKNAIPGIVQDQSATGKTVYIEPIRAVELNNDIIELTFAEKREIIRILTELADDIRPYIPDLLNNYEILSDLDFIRGKARLAMELQAEKPQLTDKPVLELHNARNPLLTLTFRNSDRKVVPLSLRIDDNQRIILISGPNAGGKSVALKTVGLVQYMTQCGFLPPVRFSSVIGIFDKIFVDIGDDQSIENDLSTYSSHLLNVKKILEQADEHSLVLIDEFGAGTDPAMGGAIAEAVLEKLLEKRVRAVITTHYSNLKHFATAREGIVNAAMLFDSDKLKPLYILELGRPGSSFALEIASSIGLPRDIISRAKEKIGSSQVDFDKILLEIERERQKISRERQEMEQQNRELREKVIKYRKEYERILREKKRLIQQANEEADRILSEANRLIENTIRQIKERQAEKEATRLIRKEFEQRRKQLNQQRKHAQQKVERDLEENLRKQKKLKTQEVSGEISVGDYVRHKSTGIKGQVMEIKDGRALVLMGNIKSFFKVSELEKLTGDEAREMRRMEKKGGVKVQMTKPGEFISALDVRGLRVDEALQKVVKFLDAAMVAGAREIRILHGTGDGILRTHIRSYLAKLDEVEWYGDADPRLGGPGVTVVRFK